MLRFARIALSNQSSHMHSSCTLCSSGVVIPAEKDEIMRQLDCLDRKSTRLNSSHILKSISYAVFCLDRKSVV